jgi:putative transposase
LRALDAPGEASKLSGKGKWVDETAVVAALIRKRTGVRNRWVAERLGMGHEGNVTRAIRRVNEYPAWKSRLAGLEAMLVRDWP